MDITVDIRETGIPEGVIGLVQRLPQPETLKGSGITITLRFWDIFVFTTGLVLLATWRKALPDGVEVVIDDSACQETTRRLLTNSGFREIIETGAEGPSTVYRFPGRIPIQPIVRGYSTEQAISDISRILDEFAGQVVDSSPFRVMLSELCENTFAHSEFETTGYMCARLNPANNICEIAVADSGIGIPNSYLEGTNEDAKQRIANGASPIDLAIDALNSSKHTPVPGTVTSHYGYGLFIVRRLVEENRGRLTIISDDECVSIERY
ncbi:MAG: ATP-binding protein [SAR202 cluster bacterium]|nr:ATP-binding protein [SAR202 cluster bacterium]MDP6663397.1 ATP-binding protein [SAR202 cluster bacterium]MDP6801407.1 ATP-binding protein [SAR202 cluster bacterium]